MASLQGLLTRSPRRIGMQISAEAKDICQRCWLYEYKSVLFFFEARSPSLLNWLGAYLIKSGTEVASSLSSYYSGRRIARASSRKRPLRRPVLQGLEEALALMIWMFRETSLILDLSSCYFWYGGSMNQRSTLATGHVSSPVGAWAGCQTCQTSAWWSSPVGGTQALPDRERDRMFRVELVKVLSFESWTCQMFLLTCIIEYHRHEESDILLHPSGDRAEKDDWSFWTLISVWGPLGSPCFPTAKIKVLSSRKAITNYNSSHT